MLNTLSLTRIWLAVAAICSTWQVLAQAPGIDTAEAPALVVQAVALDDGTVELAWHPTDYSAWEELLTSGYAVVRESVDANGRVTGAATTLAPRVLPRNATWFAANASDENVLAAVGALLYDTTFHSGVADETFDPVAVSFNLIGAEVLGNQTVAEAVGLGLTDRTARANQRYRYTVAGTRGDDGGQVQRTEVQARASVVVIAGEFGVVRSSPEYYQRWQLPSGTSLSDMRRAASPPAIVDELAVISRAYGDSLVLRWGPTTARYWRGTLSEGYAVGRLGPNDTAYTRIATVQPLPERELTRTRIGQDSAAFIAAGLVYGKGYAQDGLSLYDRASIENNSHGFALFAADASPLAADILGLRYVDRDVVADATYLYMILPLGSGPDSLEFPAGVASVVNVFTPVPAPAGVRAEAGDGSVEVTWDKYANLDAFTAYDLERAQGSGAFMKLNQRPIVFVEDEAAPLDSFTVVDTNVVNGRSYRYRITGITSFGERSEAVSEAVTPRDLTPPRGVSIYRADYNEGAGEIAVGWDLYAAEDDLSHRVVMLAETTDGPWDVVSPELGPLDTNYVYAMPDGESRDRGYFFAVRSVDKAGNASQSGVGQAIVSDLEAPLAPASIRGSVDTASMVTVTWSPSESRDVEGYWLYWGNRPNEELTVVNAELIRDTSYTYYIDKRALQREIFYAVRAEDDAANRGFVSDVVRVQRLDVIPPTAPVLLGVSALLETGTELTWEPGDDDVLEGYYVYRQATDQLEEDTTFVALLASGVDESTLGYELLAKVGPTQTSYVDRKSGTVGAAYRYRIVAEDVSGNLSEASYPLEARLQFPAALIVPKKLVAKPRGTKAVELSWVLPVPAAVYVDELRIFEVFRSSGAGALEQYELALDTSPMQFVDSDVAAGTLYNYAVRVRYANGWLGELSEVISVLVE